MRFFSLLQNIALSEKLRSELVAHCAATDCDLALRLAEMIPPGRLAQKVFFRMANEVAPDRLLDVVTAAKNSGLHEVADTVISEVSSRVLSMREADLSSFKADPRAVDFESPLEQRRASDNYEKFGLRSVDFEPDSNSLQFKEQILRSAVNDNPIGTAKWVGENLDLLEPCLSQRSDLLRYLTHGYFAKEPESAMNWAAGLGSANISELAVRYGMDAWLQIDSISASQWAGAKPVGPARDVCALAIVQHLYRLGDHQAAAAWAREIQGMNFRDAAERLLNQQP